MLYKVEIVFVFLSNEKTLKYKHEFYQCFTLDKVTQFKDTETESNSPQSLFGSTYASKSYDKILK